MGLDTMKRYKSITQVAQQMFDIPTAMVALVGHPHQHVEQHVEGEQEAEPVSSEPSPCAFCEWGIAASDPSLVVIEDASKDDRQVRSRDMKAGGTHTACSALACMAAEAFASHLNHRRRATSPPLPQV
jgi:hypothetical protein